MTLEDDIELPETPTDDRKQEELLDSTGRPRHSIATTVNLERDKEYRPPTSDEEKRKLKKKEREQVNFAKKILVIFAYCYVAMLPVYLILRWGIIRITVPQGDIPWELIIGIDAVILLGSFLWLLATTFIGVKSLEILMEFLGQGARK